MRWVGELVGRMTGYISNECGRCGGKLTDQYSRECVGCEQPEQSCDC